jgi:hypothetical protein
MIFVRPKYPLKPNLKHSAGRTGAYLALGHLTGRKYLPADLASILAKYRRSDVISWISVDDGMDIRRQMQMAEVILPDDLQRRAQELINEDGDFFCLFHRGQLLLMLQIALLVCKEDMPEANEGDLRTVMGECTLMASDILGRIENDHKPEIGETPEEVNRWVALVFASLSTVKDRSEIIARAKSFWLDLPATKSIADRLESMGIKAPTDIFQEKYGVSIRELMVFIVGMYQHSVMHADSSASPPRYEVQTFYSTIGKDTVDKTLDLFATDPDTLAYKLLSEARQNWASDLQGLRERPILRLTAEHIICPDFGLLYRCLTDGIYYLLDRAYGRKTFTQLFGYIFEEYVTNLIRQFACESSVLVRNFFASPFFQGKNDEAGDGIFHWEETAALMECKARLLTTRERYAGVSEVLMAGIDDILGKEDNKKGIDQLARNLKRLLAGERIADGNHGSDLSQCKRIYPVLVVYEGAIAIEAVRQYGDSRFQSMLRKHSVDTSKVGPLLILSLPDVEVLESLGNNPGAKRLLTEYAEFVQKNPKDRMGNFRTFVHNHGYAGMAKYSESWVAQTHVCVLTEIGDEILQRHASEQERMDTNRK